MLKITFICCGFCMLLACSAQKESPGSRGMQNLTAKYNYLYNAGLLLKNYEANLNDSYTTNFQQLLPLHLSAASGTGNSADLDLLISKAQTIISRKSDSKYIADAYLLLSKAYFLKGNYFLAKEYAAYVVKTYPKVLHLYIQGLDGTALNLMKLDQPTLAAPYLDTLKLNLQKAKKQKASPLATLAQNAIDGHDFQSATTYLEKALKERPEKAQQYRWTYILAQLFEQEKHYQQALYFYKKVEKSNAPFDLYFNALLSRFRLYGLLGQKDLDERKPILALLKEDKSMEFRDQLYDRLAQIEEAKADYDAAEKYNQLALQSNHQNKYQQGISYLRLADLQFQHFKDYYRATLYYDSALNTLPKHYPDYAQVRQKANDLSYLNERYATIALEEELQNPK
uniref:type IX secretion system periplasmic lipoprotein PorW/SprE n=1 Tax=Pedobacter sp. TaxID=1411316 RepID=UPI003D7F8B17